MNDDAAWNVPKDWPGLYDYFAQKYVAPVVWVGLVVALCLLLGAME